MKLFRKKNNLLHDLKEIPFQLEKDIQNLFEENLFQITGLEFVKSEFSIQNKRIDTLVFDNENNSFIIIEYKRNHNYSVFDQGISYLHTLLKHKADFVLEYNETLNKSLKKDKVDWSQSKVIFVSPAFNQNQKQAIDFKDLNIELWEIKQFENNIITINGISKSKAAPSIKTSALQNNTSELIEITKEIKTYSEEEHLIGKPDETIELYEEFKQNILNLSPDIKLEPKKHYLALKNSNKNISDIEILKNTIKLYINVKKGNLDDPKKLMRDVSNIGHRGNGDYQIIVKDTKNLEYLMSLVKQAIY